MTLPEGLYTTFLASEKVEIDSRKVAPGSLFLALSGRRVDGNDYAADSLRRGAIAVVVDKVRVIPDDPEQAAFYWLVSDTLQTLQALAIFHRSQLAITVLVIAGSNGKTTTKALMETVLAKVYQVHATPGNWNNYIGLPLTILQLNHTHEIALLELGANQPGEYRQLCQMAQPTHGLITNIGKDHLEGYGAFEGVVVAHREVVDYLKTNGGTFLLNAADPAIGRIATELPTIAYGPSDLEEARKLDYRGRLLARTPSIKIAVEPAAEGQPEYELTTQLYGGYNFMNVLAAASAGHVFGVDKPSIQAAIQSYTPANNRSQQLTYRQAHVILDAYNANPSSMKEALKDFESLEASCRIAILGDMHELGAYAEQEHRQMLELITSCTFRAVMVGPLFYQFSQDYNWLFFKDKAHLEPWWHEQVIQGCRILIKGSRGLALETLIQD